MPLIGNKVQSMTLRALTTSQNCQTRPFVKRLSIRTVQQISLFLNIMRGSDWFLAKIHEKSLVHSQKDPPGQLTDFWKEFSFALISFASTG